MNARKPSLLMHYEQPAAEVISGPFSGALSMLNDKFAAIMREQSWPWIISTLDHRLCRRARSQS